MHRERERVKQGRRIEKRARARGGELRGVREGGGERRKQARRREEPGVREEERGGSK